MDPQATGRLARSDDNHWMMQSQSASWRAWAGYAFESICLKHLKQIKQALGITGVSTKATTWSTWADSEGRHPGCQIDLLIERADRVINLCECKFSRDELILDSTGRDKLAAPKRIFQQATGTRSLVLLTMLSTYGVKANAHATGTIDSTDNHGRSL